MQSHSSAAAEQRTLPDREGRVDAEPGQPRLGLLDARPVAAAS